MTGTLDIARVGALMGDPSRAAMLMALMGGEALPASELAFRAGVALPTASGHLAQLVGGGLLAMERQGRHRYYRLAKSLVAEAIEALAAVTPQILTGKRRAMPEDAPMRRARTCYDHLAGRLGVAVTDALLHRHVLRPGDAGLTLTQPKRSAALLDRLGIDAQSLKTGHRPIVRTCLDWTERRPHVAGALGAAIAGRFLAEGWVRRQRDSRALSVTALGERRLKEELGVVV
jgi:DNA-binding transcriptional ArsR family regulator